MQDIIKVDSAPARLSVNFDEAKAALEAEVARYDVVVTADTVPDAKKMATELNKTSQYIQKRGREAVAEVSAPIDAFKGQIKELRQICYDGRQRILDQVQTFEDETRKQAERLLDTLRATLWHDLAVDDEFKRAEFDDLIKLTSVTAKGNLAKAVADELDRRVRDDRATQDAVRLRLLELENASYRAGLHAPLTRSHVEHFLGAEEETYASRLQSLLDTEVERQKQAEQRIQEKAEREARQKVEAEQAEIERRKRRAGEEVKEPAGGQAVAPPSSSREAWVVTCTFEISPKPGVTREAIEDELRRVMSKAGITTLTSVRAIRNSEAA